MGTRHFIGVKDINGDYKVAKYCQWDGYPSGNGANLLEWIKVIDNLDKLKEKLNVIRFYSDEEIDVVNEKLKNGDKEQLELFYNFNTRDISHEVLQNIIEDTNEEILLNDSSYFMEDGLFNEWSYIINFQTNELECYGSCDLLKKYKLDNLPSEEEFIEELDGEEND